jgi:uncharacterized protein YgiM (DUF1202 family)
MKLNWFVLFGTIVSTSLLAQQVPDAQPAAPLGVAPSVASPSASPEKTNAPANKSGRKKPATRQTHSASAKKTDPASDLRTIPLVPGPAVVDANHVNVRGQAKLKSEVVTRLNKGEAVTVLEEIVKNNSAADEPSAWAKIMLPTNAPVWVHSSFIDSNNQTVRPRKLNVRSGPGENYSVLGMLYRGEEVKPIETKGAWVEIQAPTNAYAFVAAQFLKQETPVATAPAVASAEQTTEPAAAPVTEPPSVVPAPTEPPATAPATSQEPATASSEANTTTNTAPAAVSEEPPPKRIVEREGVVRGTASIQAPTSFALYSISNGRLIDYLYTTSPYLDLRRYKGLHIIVTGEEGLEERWGNTPVITIQKIQTLDE